MFGDAVHTSKAFQNIFPEMLLPSVYNIAAELLFDSLAGTLCEESAAATVARYTEKLEMAGNHAEVPRMVEIWFHAAVASWLPTIRREHLQKLMDRIQCTLALQMKQKPSLEQVRNEAASNIRARFAALGKELSSDALDALRTWSGRETWDSTDASVEEAIMEMQKHYDRECSIYAVGVVNSVHLILSSMPPLHINMEAVGPTVIEAVLSQINRMLSSPPAMDPKVEVEIRTALCPVDEGNVEGLSEDWIRMLGEGLRGMSVHNQQAYRLPMTTLTAQQM